MNHSFEDTKFRLRVMESDSCSRSPYYNRYEGGEPTTPRLDGIFSKWVIALDLINTLTLMSGAVPCVNM